MGFDPLKDIRFIRLAHERGLGCGDIRDIAVVGDPDILNHRWGFVGPFKRMTFAARMQHKIYWGSLKKSVEWSLKTWLAPWSYIASVLYHDGFWYPAHLKRVRQALDSPWGRLFAHYERLMPPPEDLEAAGFPDLPSLPAALNTHPARLMMRSLKVLREAVMEAPEFKT